MAIPHYTGKITDWIVKEDEPDAFANAIKIMSILTVMRYNFIKHQFSSVLTVVIVTLCNFSLLLVTRAMLSHHDTIIIRHIFSLHSAFFEFVCDLIYNTTMSLIHTAIQSQVFECVLKQEIAFFDKASSGNKHACVFEI